MIVNKEYYEEFEMDLTGVCNLSCPLCSRNYLHANHMVYKHVRPLKDIIKQLETFPNLKRAFIAGQISEPTLYPEFLEYLKYLKSRNIYIELFSNGSTRDAFFWKEVGNILDKNDQVHFTICGSTQELHAKYRIGSDLNKILDNASSLRSAKKCNDYCQFIVFEYNKFDENNTKNFGFSNWYSIGSEGRRLKNNYVKNFAIDIKPIEIRNKIINYLYAHKPEANSNNQIICKSIHDKKIYITQDGKISACYVHHEYSKDDVFKSEAFDYTDILNFKFEECWACTKKCSYLIKKLGVDFVC